MALLVLSGLHGTEANASQLKQKKKKKKDSLCKDIGVSQLWLERGWTVDRSLFTSSVSSCVLIVSCCVPSAVNRFSWSV